MSRTITSSVAILALLTLAVPPLGAQEAAPVAHRAAPADRPPIPHTERSRITVEHRPEERVVELVVGPVELRDGMPHLRLPVQMAEMPTSGWIRGFDWRITDGEGETLPDALLHHVNVVDPDRRQLFDPTPLRVLAAGRETRRAMLPPVLGIPFDEGTRLMVSAMFANATGADYPDARLHVRIRYLKAEGRLIRPHEVLPFYLDVTGPVGRKDFAVPPGRTVKAWEGSPEVEARILGAGGHLHDYAERIRLIDLTADRVLWSAEPNASAGGRVYSVPEGHFWWGGGIPVRPDHRYRVEVVYHNPTDRPSPLGGMGVVAGAVVPRPDASWPALDRSNRDYCLDLMNHVTAPRRLSGHGHGGDGHGGHGHGGDEPPAYAEAPCRAAFSGVPSADEMAGSGQGGGEPAGTDGAARTDEAEAGPASGTAQRLHP